jgi:hypothetical protein
MFLGVSTFAQDDADMKVPARGKKGRIQVITDPPNSDVYLGGKFLGKSPINDMVVQTGRQTLVVVDQGYELVNVRFNVWPDSLNVYNARTVIPKGGIEVTTIPSKCYITIDGESADYTDGSSLLVKNLDAGDHTVGAKCGNKFKEMLVTVKGEETAKVTIDVTKK